MAYRWLVWSKMHLSCLQSLTNSLRLNLKFQNMMISRNPKQLFVKTFWFQETRRPERYTAEFTRKLGIISSRFTLEKITKHYNSRVCRNKTGTCSVFFFCWPVYFLDFFCKASVIRRLRSNSDLCYIS